MLGDILVLSRRPWVTVFSLARNNAGPLGVIRDPDGARLCGFSEFIGISNNLHVKLFAIMHGLKLPLDRGHRNVICYSDPLHALNLIQAPLNA
ncbi:hypothetical protein MTR_5g014470 [Medicago truncatula]|uniref:RNase H type-1 domain-containing protein n=1 Tax=Medicago truncatula TaxID=3880 RepID=G7K121_MEDTR|nr:hypothetical protein MTR_5g014470 [Medicago truncatula]